MEAARAVNTDGSTIKRAALGERNHITAKGYFWRPVGTPLTKEEIDNILNNKEENKLKGLAVGQKSACTPVVKIDIKTGKVLAEYSSLKEAADANGTYYQTVSAQCRMKKKNKRLKSDYVFQFKSDYQQNEWFNKD